MSDFAGRPVRAQSVNLVEQAPNDGCVEAREMCRESI